MMRIPLFEWIQIHLFIPLLTSFIIERLSRVRTGLALRMQGQADTYLPSWSSQFESGDEHLKSYI